MTPPPPTDRARTPTRALLAGPLLAGPLLAACEEQPRTFRVGARAGEVLLREDFERDQLGPRWRTTGPGARIERGHLVLAGLRNHPVWLTTPLPPNVRVSFDAWADTNEGDIKFELAGDGESFARAVNYRATGYVFIFGGWNNSRNMIARKDEHGEDVATSTTPLPEAGRRVHMTVWREGPDLRWEVDGREILSYHDPDPLTGPAHAHFAFGNWMAQTRFDNLVIEAL